MERIKDIRSVTLPDGNLARRDVRSQLVSVPTGKFTRNCVLTGKSSADMDFPLYIRPPGIISPVKDLAQESLGYFDASEGKPDNALPFHNAITKDPTYWLASNLGCWITYHHELRPTMIRGYRFVTENGYTPRVWRVEGSNDNVTWTTLHSVTVDWTWGTGKQAVDQEVPPENRDYFMHHRLIVDEFDAASIRIYYLQFWDALCPSNADIYVDADTENPLQLAFANGYNPDGTPNDILFTINTPAVVGSEDLLEVTDTILPTPCILFAEYDPIESAVSFKVDIAIQGVPMNTNNFNILSSSFTFDETRGIFNDDSLSVYFNSYNMQILLSLTSPLYTPSFYLNMGSSNLRILISEDFGMSWEDVGVFTGSSETLLITLNRHYYITQIRLRNVSRYLNLYYFNLVLPTEIYYKLSEGKVYQYNTDTEAWNQVYKIPLGSLYLFGNPDGTQAEIGHFVPTHIPQMSVAPYFTKTRS